MDKLKKKLNKLGYEIIDKKYFDRGGHGQLFKCKNISTNEICAVKLEKKKDKY